MLRVLRFRSSLFIAFLGLLLGLFSQRVAAQTAPVSDEYQALAELYNSTNGAGWGQSDNWLTGDSPCGWYGVTCNETGQVIRLELASNQLIGPLPASLSALTQLQTLDLSDNQLSGPIPGSLSALTSLKRLVLIYNQLNGPFPESLSALSNLEFIYLSHNQLSGPLPESLSALTNLVNLYVASNQLSGPIPAGLFSLTNLQALDLSENQLSGPIPTDLSGLSGLKRLSLFYNQLSGPLPDGLAALKSLEYLHIAYNQLTGSIPESLLTLANLQTLNINNNQLSGPIPDSLPKLTKLAYADFSYNQFTGPVPAGLAKMPSLLSCELQNNQLSGCLPAALSALCERGVSVVLSGNPDLAGNDFASFCSQGTGRCDLQASLINFWLMNAETGQAIQQLTNGADLNLSSLLTTHLNIQATTSPVLVDSVVLVLSGRQNRTQIEREAPYSLFKDTRGAYRSWIPTVGQYWLTATPYTSTDGRVTAGTPLSLSFTVSDLPTVMGFQWINAETGQFMQELRDGDVVDLSNLPTRLLNIQVNTGLGTDGLMRLELTGQQARTQTESKAPYTLVGNTGGNYRSWTPVPGTYQLTATPFSGYGSEGTHTKLSFTVVDPAPAARLAGDTRLESAGLRTLYYPNPFREGFTLKTPGTSPQAVRIYDLSGRLVWQQANSPAEQRIQLDQKWGAGVYILQVGDGSTAQRYKLVKAP